MSSRPKLTPFSYATLALVGRDGASPHDIVRMMREGRGFWTTSESHFYAEPKKLEELGLLAAEKRPGRTRERTHYTLTEAGREALRQWLAQPAAMPRIQNEAALKLVGADLADDDATILRSLAGLREGIAAGYRDLEQMEARVAAIPHRTRYLRLLNELARRQLDMQREWLDHVEAELGGA
jgi:DNA-binding PadR family transcriptional regulator